MVESVNEKRYATDDLEKAKLISVVFKDIVACLFQE